MTIDAADGLGLRERTRRAVRAELIAVGMSLFARQGYDETTIDEVAAAAGMSRSSFFRYFGSKEDLILGHMGSVGVAVADALANRPADEDAWTALRRAFDVVLAHNARDPQTALGLRRMMDGYPALQARNMERQSRWYAQLVPHIAARLDPPPATLDPPPGGVDARAEALIGAALACMEAVNRAWQASDGALLLDQALDDVMRAVHPGSF